MERSSLESLMNDYDIIEKLGKGGQGTVWKAERKTDGQIIALKIINDINDEAYKTAHNEIEYLKQISKPQCNPFLACYYDSFHDHDDKRFVIEMEYIDGQEVDDFVKPYQQVADKSKLYRYILLIVKDLVKGLAVIHSKGLIHNDIKPANIIIDKELTPKLVDFGLACMAKKFAERKDVNLYPLPGSKPKECIFESKDIPCCGGVSGTPYYVAPEMISAETRYPSSDIWSLGVTIFYLATHTYPFNFHSRDLVNDVLRKIKYGEVKKLNTGNELLDTIVNRSLVKDPFNRITTEEIGKMLENL